MTDPAQRAESVKIWSNPILVMYTHFQDKMSRDDRFGVTIVNVDEEAGLAKSLESGTKGDSSVRRGASRASRLHCKSHRNWVERRRVSGRLAAGVVGETSFISNTGHMQQTPAHLAVM